MIASDVLKIAAAVGLLLWVATFTPAGPYVPPGTSNVPGFVLIDPVTTPAPALEADLSGRIPLAPDVKPGAGEGARYSNLLRKIEVPADRASYGEFYDWGYWSGTSWAGHTDLPPGYWVYVDGWWYIYGNAAGATPPGNTSVVDPAGGKRAWGPEQATGAPDTPQPGDIQTAWASLTADGQPEWLELTYDEAVDAVAVIVHETYNPGAVTKITLFDAEGNEHVVYEGAPAPAAPFVDIFLGESPQTGTSPAPQPIDPAKFLPPNPDYDGLTAISTVPPSGRRTLVAPVNVGFATQKVKVYLDSPAVPGWNEIDAVGLIDAYGNTRWASGATASSTYADRVEQNVGGPFATGTVEVIPYSPEERVRRLEEEVRQLQAEIEQLKSGLQLPVQFFEVDVAPPR